MNQVIVQSTISMHSYHANNLILWGLAACPQDLLKNRYPWPEMGYGAFQLLAIWSVNINAPINFSTII